MRHAFFSRLSRSGNNNTELSEKLYRTDVNKFPKNLVVTCHLSVLAIIIKCHKAEYFINFSATTHSTDKPHAELLAKIYKAEKFESLSQKPPFSANLRYCQLS